jgi:hypothetical protein
MSDSSYPIASRFYIMRLCRFKKGNSYPIEFRKNLLRPCMAYSAGRFETLRFNTVSICSLTGFMDMG